MGDCPSSCALREYQTVNCWEITEKNRTLFGSRTCKPPAVQCVAPPVKNQPSAVLSTPPKGGGPGANGSGYGPLFNTIWVCLKMVSTPTPNGFADHYPVFKWLFHWEYTLFSDKPIWTKLAIWISKFVSMILGITIKDSSKDRSKFWAGWVEQVEKGFKSKSCPGYGKV